MKLIIAGTRTFADYELVKKKVLFYLNGQTDIEIVSGSCSSGAHTFTRDNGTMVFGADGLGERFAKENNYPVKIFDADWNKHGLAAGPIRNREMANYSDACICFWDERSKEAKNMINEALNRHLKVAIIRYNK